MQINSISLWVGIKKGIAHVKCLNTVPGWEDNKCCCCVVEDLKGSGWWKRHASENWVSTVLSINGLCHLVQNSYGWFRPRSQSLHVKSPQTHRIIIPYHFSAKKQALGPSQIPISLVCQSLSWQGTKSLTLKYRFTQLTLKYRFTLTKRTVPLQQKKAEYKLSLWG